MLRSRLALFFGAVVGLTASQIPEYAQQYRQRLGGAIDELQKIVSQFDADSAQLGLSEEQGIARLSGDGDEFIRERGLQMEQIVARLQTLSRANADMARSGSLGRLAALAADFDPLIARQAYASYEPAVPVTSEGFVLAGLGFLTGFGLFRALTAPLRRFSRRRPMSTSHVKTKT
ncbi:conserved hypothetical protein [Methylocella tundrae]|uniref:DUF2937 domain-containing protein n=1 Tax=Methylocella tundrae TaxID=227605 RepID=A0A8B6M4K3_METTU|nr:DUF2937 family protein [Methylocella tundrae]VTZ24287.1 conserved hypothetical protein [Methylocella tundrae]VTZ49293.1 conserved hypothetical protein [Methylocella tundrae]